ncbi:MAG TPA: DUF4234 domain-containing protein [Solirubrobacterales bacterium]|jgi:hypothetical protein
MAAEVQISPGCTAKIRHPVAVPVLTIVTLGIYGIYWWYQINREMVDLGKAKGADGLGENATTSLLAVFPGFLILIPPYFSLYNGVKRMQRSQEVTTGDVTFNGWIVLILILGGFVIGFTSIIVPGYIQSEMNKVWATLEGGGTASAVPETPATVVTPPEPPAQV